MALSTELISKSKAELTTLLHELKAELYELQTKVSTRELKDVRRVRTAKKRIARILTIMNRNV